MIQANELRIGNIIKRRGFLYEDKNYYETIVSHNDITACVISPDKFKPIPLTEEWLLKFGFEKGNDFYGDCFYIETEKEDFVLHPEKDCFYFLYDLVEVKYVHQLQNLYFALTNEELTLKP